MWLCSDLLPNTHLISVGQLESKGLEFSMKNGKCYVFRLGALWAVAQREICVYYLVDCQPEQLVLQMNRYPFEEPQKYRLDCDNYVKDSQHEKSPTCLESTWKWFILTYVVQCTPLTSRGTNIPASCWAPVLLQDKMTPYRRWCKMAWQRVSGLAEGRRCRICHNSTIQLGNEWRCGSIPLFNYSLTSPMLNSANLRLDFWVKPPYDVQSL